MDKHRAMIYKAIMRKNPVIDQEYIADILQIEKESIEQIKITDVKESNTALTIKVQVLLKSPAGQYIKKLFIKTVISGGDQNGYSEMSVREGAFYQLIHEYQQTLLPVPNCYDVYMDEQTKEFVIVLEDLSDQTRCPGEEDRKLERVWIACAGSLARFHAAFWNISAKLDITSWLDSTAEIERSIQKNHKYLEQFLKEYDQDLNQKTKDIFWQAMLINDRLMRQRQGSKEDDSKLTICNGDSHIYNFMIPTDEHKEPLIVDFQFWHYGYGTGDLAHLTRVDYVRHFSLEQQMTLLRYYYDTLVQCGVTGYSWEECLNDYRMDIAAMVLIPLWQACCFNVPYEEWICTVDDLTDNFQAMECIKSL